MKKFFLIFLIISAVSGGCAKIPVESVQLSDAIMMQGARMHNYNVSMVNDLFNEKKKQINDFMEKEYIPEMIKNFTSGMDTKLVTAANLPDILADLIPEINAQYNAVAGALEEQRLKLVTRMNAEYQAYYDASLALHTLLQSAVNVDNERAALNDRIKELSGNKIDLNQVEHSVDEFITKAGSPDNIQGAILDFSNNVNQILNQQK